MPKNLLYLIGIVLLVIFLGIAVFALWFAIRARPRRRREPGFEYVYVEDDGGARELNTDEREYLSTKFHPADGARPYIKFRYKSLTPDGMLSGYLRRRQLPKDVVIRQAPTGEP